MGSLVLTGATSGATTITPSATGTYTITLPAETGTIQTSGAGFTTNGVAYATSTSALATGSALTFNGTNTFTVKPATGIAYNRTESTQYSTFVQHFATSGGTGLEYKTLYRFVDTDVGERARIDSSGRLLVNATTSVVSGDEAAGFVGLSGISAKATNSSANFAGAFWNSATSGDNVFLTFLTETGGTGRGTITYNRAGGLTAYNTTSDYRAKTVKGLVQNALSKVALLKPCTGRMNDATQDIDFFVAHELQEVVASAVTGEKDAVNEDNTPKYQMVDKSALIPLLTASIQELSTLITAQSATITSLTERITALENK